jgi:hypothetical protein
MAHMIFSLAPRYHKDTSNLLPPVNGYKSANFPDEAGGSNHWIRQ